MTPRSWKRRTRISNVFPPSRMIASKGKLQKHFSVDMKKGILRKITGNVSQIAGGAKKQKLFSEGGATLASKTGTGRVRSFVVLRQTFTG